MEKVKDFYHHSLLYFLCRLKKMLSPSIYIYFSLCSSRFPHPRSGVAMPFGCLTIGEKKDYNNPSDVTDKYDLGQIVKSWVSQTGSTRTSWIKLPSLQGLCLYNPVKFFLSGRSSVRYSEPRTEPRWRCTRVKSSWRRTGGRSARLPKTRSSSWRCEYFFIGSCSLQLSHLCNKCLAPIPSFYPIYLSVYTSGSPSPAATTDTILQGVTKLISIF